MCRKIKFILTTYRMQKQNKGKNKQERKKWETGDKRKEMGEITRKKEGKEESSREERGEKRKERREKRKEKLQKHFPGPQSPQSVDFAHIVILVFPTLFRWPRNFSILNGKEMVHLVVFAITIPQ